MDYVVYGTGYGATLMLLGYAIRTWGPGWRFRDGEEAAYDRREFLSARSSWRRFTAGLGAAVATAGAGLVLLTLVLMLMSPSDELGSTVALVVSGLLLAGVAAWAWLFHSRFGTWGIVALPDALTSYEPMTYDSRTARTGPVAAAREAADGEDVDLAEAVDDENEDEDEEQLGLGIAHDEDELETDITDDEESELAARYSKFQVHHPDEDDGGDADGGTDDRRFEAQSSTFESHHPDDDATSSDAAASGAGDDEEIVEIDEYVEALTPEEVSEDIVDHADEEPAGDGDPDNPVETYEDLVGDRARTDLDSDAAAVGDAIGDAVGDAVEKDPLEVLPEAHEEIAPLIEPAPHEREDAGGREDALRRLRERQAERARQRAADDA